MFTEQEKQTLLGLIQNLKQAGIDAHSLAIDGLNKVLKQVEPNRELWRKAWYKPTGFYLLHTTEEAIAILKGE